MSVTYESLGYFDARHDLPGSAPPRHRYAILSSQRTGSNYLCARLSNLKGRLGSPMEYLHADAIRLMGARLFPGVAGEIGLDAYFDAVARVRTTRDGWFGTKIQPDQLLPAFGGDPAGPARFLAGFDRLIFMTRRDKLRQAVSGALAEATGTWFNHGEEPDPGRIDPSRLFPAIDRLLAKYADEERWMLALSSQLDRLPRARVVYEELLADSDGIFRQVAGFIDSQARIAEEEVRIEPTRKPPGNLADRIREAYLERQEGRQWGFASCRAGRTPPA